VSFFDEPEETRTAPRRAPRRRRTSGGSRRPPSANRQAIQIRRGILVAVVVIVVVLIAVGVHSCQVSARNTSLKNYNDNVASLNEQSVQTGSRFFGLLAGGTSNTTSLSTQLYAAVNDADSQLKQAKGLNVPDEVNSAQSNFVLALEMRHDGMANIAADVPPALQSTTSKDAINAIAAEMARFYASDVLYKDYTVPLVIGALRAAGITVGGLGGQQINGSQFLPNVAWLTPSYIASELKVSLPSSPTKISPGLHGHELNTVTVAGTTLTPGGSATLSASPPPQFTLGFANTGQNVENNVKCKVSVSGTSDSATTVVPQTNPGQSYTCQVTLPSAPPTGSQTVVATIVPVPGEKNVANNTQTFTITFQ
jgi:hypothetical protein